MHEWQTRFLEGIRGKGSVEGLFREAPLLGARFGVYREGYWLRASESLEEDFPLTQRLLGTARFEGLMRDFLATGPGSLLELGELSPAFAAFARSRAIGAAEPRALALDLLAVDARRAPEPEAMPGGGFGLHPSARFYGEGRRRYVFWRADGSVLRERIEDATARLLLALREPAPAAELGDRLGALELEPEFVRVEVALWAEDRKSVV